MALTSEQIKHLRAVESLITTGNNIVRQYAFTGVSYGATDRELLLECVNMLAVMVEIGYGINECTKDRLLNIINKGN